MCTKCLNMQLVGKIFMNYYNLNDGLCFICSEETEGRIDTEFLFFCVHCHKDCWDQACCNLVEFPEGFISGEEFKKLTGVDISCVCCINADGTKCWRFNGKLHREDGPAIEDAGGSKEWLQHGKLHREDGPAIELVNGSKYWYLDDNRLSKHAFNQLVKEKNKREKK